MNKKRFACLGALLLLAALALGAGPVQRTAVDDLFDAMRANRVAPPVPAPDVTMSALDGGSIRLVDLQGHAVIVGFFVTGCPSCRREAPDRISLSRKFKAQGLAVLGVNLEEEPEAVEAFGKAFGIPFPLLLDRDGRTQKLFGLKGHPSTALIDRHGHIVGRILGERNWASPAADRLVRWLLESEDRG